MALLENMPPWHGGGEMILSVSLEASTYKPPPHRFEAGTPDIAGVIGLGAAIDYLEAIGLENIQRHDHNLANYAVQQHARGPRHSHSRPAVGHRGSLVAFHLDFAHPHDFVEFANSHGIAMRGGHHCTQPLMKRFKVPGTTRASFYFYNTLEEINRLVEVLHAARAFFT
jgi:cysteine desulfurase/selenocysteine lyase